MHHSDEELLDFDKTGLEDWDEARSQAALDGQDAAVYRNHLHIAMHLDQWVQREGERPKGSSEEESHSAGFVHALEELAAHFRQTYYLPEGHNLGSV
ncbi:hypothetical protein ACF1D2_30200 [Streptomyces bacillaris]|uniref:hypothetical protein n=1 Tax=Streptomyces bacillaris TaxID=68179 RepID=UPI003702B25D